MWRKFACLILPLWLLSLSGCALCVGGAIGAGAGYLAHKEGVRVRSPLVPGPGKPSRPSGSPWAAPDQRGN